MKTKDMAKSTKTIPKQQKLPTFISTILTATAVAIIGKSYIIRLWNSVGVLFQSNWEKFLGYTGEDPVILWVNTPIVVMLIFYWGEGLIYILMDVTNKPYFLRKYKIQPGTNEPVDGMKLLNAVLTVLFCQTILTYPISKYIILWFMENRGYPSFRELPSFQSILLDLAIMMLIGEVSFYYCHRLLHSKYLFKYIHRKHHEWTSPISITALYAHPLEYVLANMVALNFGYMVAGSHVFTAYLYYIIGVTKTLNAHCGYHFPFNVSPEFHDYHHLHFNECFGLSGLMDHIHGTDKNFKTSKEYQRHEFNLHRIAPRVLVPDDL